MIKRISKIAALGLVFLLVAGISAYLTLTLIIKSEDTVIVPDLVGKDVASALERLTDLQLNTKVRGSQYSQEFPKNHVIFQDPEPGSEIKKDRDVRIIISKGPKNILMPNLVALSLHQARMIMEENGITQSLVSHTYSHKVEKDHIIAHVPAAGSMITRGASVNLLLSLGMRPKVFKMPDLDGRSMDQAVFAIEKANLNVGEIRSQFDTHKPLNVVVRQEPLAGYRVIENTPVHLVINRPSGGKAMGNLHRGLYGSLLHYQLENGFLKKRIRVELESENTSAEIFDAFIKPGEELWLLVPRDRDTTVFIFEDDNLAETLVYKAW